MIRLVEVAEFNGRSEELRDTSRMTDRERVGEAFRVWRKLTGGRARGAFACCGNCGHHELAGMDEEERSFVFWHRQADDAFDSSGELDYERPLYIQHEAQPEELELLVGLLSACGLVASWSGEQFRCVEARATRW